MQRKLEDYFAGGVRLVWYIDAAKRTATTYTSPTDSVSIPENGTLSGGAVLPGFMLSLEALFQRAGKRPGG